MHEYQLNMFSILIQLGREGITSKMGTYSIYLQGIQPKLLLLNYVSPKKLQANLEKVSG